MANALKHRGPDGWGMKWFENIRGGLAHTRLSILDLSSAGHQPMKSPRQPLWLTFNGEIYNFKSIRQILVSHGFRFTTDTDSEVVLAAYEYWGVDCVRHFEGMFAFAIFNESTNELFLARDRLGIKPLYTFHRGHHFAFASEAKALLEIESINKEIDTDALLSSLLLLWVPEPKTGWKSIAKFPPAHYGVVRDGKLTSHRYWALPTEMDEPRSAKQLIDELDKLLNESVAEQMQADVPVGAFLSGGLDSSLVVALMRKHSPNSEINTYTTTFSDDVESRESASSDKYFARQVAEYLRTNHAEIQTDISINSRWEEVLYHLDEPIADGAALNTVLISEQARRDGVLVLLNGMGGDELFGGYRKQLATLLSKNFLSLPQSFREKMLTPLVHLSANNRFATRAFGTPLRFASKFLSSIRDTPLETFVEGFAYLSPTDVRSLLRDTLPSDIRDWYPFARYYNEQAGVAHLPLLKQMTWLDTTLFLPGLNLCYSDKATMLAGVETRPPLLSTKIVEFAMRLPCHQLIRQHNPIRFTQKYLLKKVAERYLPKAIIYRPKAPFTTPLRSWMRGKLGEEVLSLSKSFFSTSLTNNTKPLIAEKLVEHVIGSQDNAHSLWGIHSLMKWKEMTKTRFSQHTQSTPSERSITT